MERYAAEHNYSENAAISQKPKFRAVLLKEDGSASETEVTSEQLQTSDDEGENYEKEVNVLNQNTKNNTEKNKQNPPVHLHRMTSIIIMKEALEDCDKEDSKIIIRRNKNRKAEATLPTSHSIKDMKEELQNEIDMRQGDEDSLSNYNAFTPYLLDLNVPSSEDLERLSFMPHGNTNRRNVRSVERALRPQSSELIIDDTAPITPPRHGGTANDRIRIRSTGGKDSGSEEMYEESEEIVENECNFEKNHKKCKFPGCYQPVIYTKTVIDKSTEMYKYSKKKFCSKHAYFNYSTHSFDSQATRSIKNLHTNSGSQSNTEEESDSEDEGSTQSTNEYRKHHRYGFASSMSIRQAVSFVEDARKCRFEMHKLDKTSLRRYYMYHNPFFRSFIIILVFFQLLGLPMIEAPSAIPSIPAYVAPILEVFICITYLFILLFKYSFLVTFYEKRSRLDHIFDNPINFEHQPVILRSPSQNLQSSNSNSDLNSDLTSTTPPCDDVSSSDHTSTTPQPPPVRSTGPPMAPETQEADPYYFLVSDIKTNKYMSILFFIINILLIFDCFVYIVCYFQFEYSYRILRVRSLISIILLNYIDITITMKM